MPRMHLFEFEDQPWFPSALRRGITDYIAFSAQYSDALYRDFVRRLKVAMQAMGERRLLDLASGGSGPVQPIVRLLEEQEHYPVQATLTDLYPNVESFERVKANHHGRIDFVPTPVDATQVPPHLVGFRMMCSSFHHLPPDKARQVLADAVARRRGIAIFELVDRSPASFVASALAPVNLVAVTPFIRPLRLNRLVFTYLVPLIPAALAWDGVVSCLRVYSVKELRSLTEGLADDYHWDIARQPVEGLPLHVHTLIGYPMGPQARG